MKMAIMLPIQKGFLTPSQFPFFISPKILECCCCPALFVEGTLSTIVGRVDETTNAEVVT